MIIVIDWRDRLGYTCFAINDTVVVGAHDSTPNTPIEKVRCQNGLNNGNVNYSKGPAADSGCAPKRDAQHLPSCMQPDILHEAEARSRKRPFHLLYVKPNDKPHPVQIRSNLFYQILLRPTVRQHHVEFICLGLRRCYFW
jgi:hypothetical protein